MHSGGLYLGIKFIFVLCDTEYWVFEGDGRAEGMTELKVVPQGFKGMHSIGVHGKFSQFIIVCKTVSPGNTLVHAMGIRS